MRRQLRWVLALALFGLSGPAWGADTGLLFRTDCTTLTPVNDQTWCGNLSTGTLQAYIGGTWQTISVPSLPVPPAQGGTGLTGVGTADQVLATNHGATAMEWKSLAGTAGRITMTGGAGTLTADLDTVGTAGSYSYLTTDAYGRVTAGSLVSVNTGAGLSGGGALSSTLSLVWAPNTQINSFTVFDGSQATRTITYDLSGTDPVLTFASGVMNLSTGTLQQGGTAVVLASRNVNTTSPLTGGGALSGDLTLACPTCVTASGGPSLSGTGTVRSDSGTLSVGLLKADIYTTAGLPTPCTPGTFARTSDVFQAYYACGTSGLLWVHVFGPTVEDAGASGSSVGPFAGTMGAGSTTLTLNAGGDFVNGQGINIAGAGTAHAMSTPSAPSVSNAGAAGSTTYQYKIKQQNATGGLTTTSSVGQTTTGNATLTNVNFNIVTWSNVATATWTCIYRNDAGTYTLRMKLPANYTLWNDMGQFTTAQGAAIFADQDCPLTDSSAAVNNRLLTTVTGGGRTTTLTVLDASTPAVTNVRVVHDDTVALNAMCQAVGLYTNITGLAPTLPFGPAVHFTPGAIVAGVPMTGGYYRITSPLKCGGYDPTHLIANGKVLLDGQWGSSILDFSGAGQYLLTMSGKFQFYRYEAVMDSRGSVDGAQLKYWTCNDCVFFHGDFIIKNTITPNVSLRLQNPTWWNTSLIQGIGDHVVIAGGQSQSDKIDNGWTGAVIENLGGTFVLQDNFFTPGGISADPNIDQEWFKYSSQAGRVYGFGNHFGGEGGGRPLAVFTSGADGASLILHGGQFFNSWRNTLVFNDVLPMTVDLSTVEMPEAVTPASFTTTALGKCYNQANNNYQGGGINVTRFVDVQEQSLTTGLGSEFLACGKLFHPSPSRATITGGALSHTGDTTDASGNAANVTTGSGTGVDGMASTHFALSSGTSGDVNWSLTFGGQPFTAGFYTIGFFYNAKAATANKVVIAAANVTTAGVHYFDPETNGEFKYHEVPVYLDGVGTYLLRVQSTLNAANATLDVSGIHIRKGLSPGVFAKEGVQPLQLSTHFFTCTAAPSSGTFVVGDTCINTNPVVGGVILWRNIVAGSPGTWEAVYGSSRTVVTVNAGNSPYTILGGDRDLVCDTTAAGRTINLSAISGQVGRMVRIKSLGSNTCTIARAGSDTIEGATSLTISIANTAVDLVAGAGASATDWGVY